MAEKDFVTSQTTPLATPCPGCMLGECRVGKRQIAYNERIWFINKCGTNPDGIRILEVNAQFVGTVVHTMLYVVTGRGW
jgi:hypothetical protein